MKRFVFDQVAYDADQILFPPEFDWPGPYFYHGTTGALCERIEREGLHPASSGITRRECEAVLSVFAEINWAGWSMGGAPSLRSFSLTSDLVHPRGDPLFLTEYPATASYYASQYYAGGEKVSAIRSALADLDRLVNDKKFRLAQGRAFDEALDPTRTSGLGDAATVELVRNRLADLSQLRERCQAWHDGHTHGMIYAIHLDEAFSREHCEPAGIAFRVFAPIGPEALKACVRLPRDFRRPV